MKITMITGSPHRRGTSALLADEFAAGATKAGHEVYRFDAAFEDLHPCKACEHCHTGEDGCVWRDAMDELRPHILDADAIVFVTPVYYFTMSTQLKMVIDRFYAFNAEIQGTGKKTALLATAMAANDSVMDNLKMTYRDIIRYLGWDNAGMVLATGVATRGAIEGTDWPDKAFKLGVSFGTDSEDSFDDYRTLADI